MTFSERRVTGLGRKVRLALGALSLIVAAAVGVVLWRGLPILTIGLAYKAKMVCSGVFVSGRPAADVVAETEVDDLELLRRIRTRVDPSDGSVSASAFGFFSRRAVVRASSGCALSPGGMRSDEFRVSTAYDHVEPGQRLPSRPLDEAPPDDPLRIALNTLLDRAFDEPVPGRPRRTQAAVILHRGRIVAERYAPGITEETPLLGWSMTKSVMNALAGIMVRQGRLALDSAVPMPSWRSPGDPRGAITLAQMLHMESGLRFDDNPGDIRSDVVRMLLAEKDMAAFADGLGLEATPGSRWHYASGTSVLLARAMRNAMNDDSAYVRFPREALFDRIGMRTAVLETDASGTWVGSSLMYASARDWARFGQLYLNDGAWNGERILPEGWVRFTATPAPHDPTRGYGAHFWLPRGDSARGRAPLPEGTLQAAGHEGQFVTIVPSHQAVIVRLGKTRYDASWSQEAFVDAVLAVIALDRR